MRTKLLILAVSLSAVMASSAFAGDIKPLHSCPRAQQSLGTTATARDKYTATCPAGTVRYEAQIRDQLPNAAPTVSITIIGGSPAVGTDSAEDFSSTTSCLFTGMSAYAKKSAGTGPYLVEVYKSASGSENYRISDHCVSSTGADLGSPASFVQTQNQ
jgi:hypothetical protein